MVYYRGSILRAPTLHLCGEYHVPSKRLGFLDSTAVILGRDREEPNGLRV